MPVFMSHHRVTIVRDVGSPTETRHEANMGGDLDRKALFYMQDRVQTGDQIYYEFFDEPRVIVRVVPEQTSSGPSHWRAEMMPLSEWRRHTALRRNVHVSGQGARVNINSVDQSVQNFHSESKPNQAVFEALDEVKAAIEQLAVPAAAKADAKVTTEQIGMELKRSKPEKAIVWRLIERLNTIGGLVEKAAKLADIADRSGLLS